MSRHYATKTAVPERTASRPVVVADDLSRLCGPVSGIVTLPLDLNWTPRRAYDMASPSAVRSLYQVVLREARTEADLEQHLDRDLLRALWPTLTLPKHIRQAWEAIHPSLAV